jgi:hypothetical protein
MGGHVPLVALVVFLVAPPAYTENATQPGRGVVAVESEQGEPKPLYRNSHALLIGVSQYTSGWQSIDSIPKELESVEAALKAQGFVVEKIPDPDAAALEHAYEDFFAQHGYGEEDRLLIYFAGHGHTRDNGKAYLVPTDAPSPETDESGFLKKALPMSQIMQWAREIETKHALFLFDSCFSGSIFKTRGYPAIPPHITADAAEPVRQFITAGGAKESVPEQSVFTPAFVDALTYGYADRNSDGYTTGAELGLYLHEEVPKYARQNPQYGKISDYDLSLGDFVFRTGKSAMPRPIPARPHENPVDAPVVQTPRSFLLDIHAEHGQEEVFLKSSYGSVEEMDEAGCNSVKEIALIDSREQCRSRQGALKDIKYTDCTSTGRSVRRYEVSAEAVCETRN